MTVPGDVWAGRPVLVTGATGLLGQWVVRRLVERDARVVALVYEPDLVGEWQRIELPRSVSVVPGDVRDAETLAGLLAAHGVQTVFHLAAQAIVGVAAENPRETFDVNVRGTWELLEACRGAPAIESIVVASSDKAYGTAVQLPYTEDMPLRATHPYDVSKACAEMLACSYASSFELPVAVTRCGNLYGGGDLNWSRLVPGTIRSVLHGEGPVIRSDGTYERDYLFAGDAADAYLLLAEHLAADPALRGEAFNIAAGQPVAALDLANTIVGIMGADVVCEIRDEARGEIVAQHLDPSKAREVLGWSAVTSLAEGLPPTIAWYRSYFADRH